MERTDGRTPSSTRSREARRGGALLVATIAVSVVAVITTCLLQAVSVSAKREQSAVDTRRAFYLAEAGLADAYSGIRIGKTGRIGSAAIPAVLGDGLFWVEATDPVDGRIELTSTAMCGIGRVSLSMEVEKGEQSVATLGVFSSRALNIPRGSTIQGFDSSQEPPVPTTGRLGSNENIAATGTMAQPIVIRADLAPGPAHVVSLGAYVTHTGGIEPRDAAVNLPPVTVPHAPSSPGIEHDAPIPLVLPEGDVGIAFLKVAADSQVIAQGPCNLVVNDLVLEPGASLEFDTELGPVRLWVIGALTMNAGSEITCSDTDPSQVLVQLASGTPASLSSTGHLYGVVYAPNAEVTVGSQLEMHGSLVARQLVLMPGAKLSFDQHLDDTSAEAQMPKLLSWRILELASSAGPGGVRDPFAMLGLDPAALPNPANAHEDQVLDIVYSNLSGATRTYAGMESGFDWTQVQDVDALSRDGVAIALPPPEPPPAPPPPPSPALAAIRDLSLDSHELKDVLRNLSPLTVAEIVGAIGRDPAMTSGDLKDVLKETSPMTSGPLLAAIDRLIPMDSNHLRDVLKETRPLPPEVLARVITGPTALNSHDREDVLRANGIDEP